MRTIWKYELGVGRTDLELPVGAELCAFAAQGNKLCLWCEVDPDAEVEARSFIVVGTGWAVEDVWEYFATTQAGEFVWHCYEDRLT